MDKYDLVIVGGGAAAFAAATKANDLEIDVAQPLQSPFGSASLFPDPLYFAAQLNLG